MSTSTPRGAAQNPTGRAAEEHERGHGHHHERGPVAALVGAPTGARPPGTDRHVPPRDHDDHDDHSGHDHTGHAGRVGRVAARADDHDHIERVATRPGLLGRVDLELAGVAVSGVGVGLGMLGGWLGWPEALVTACYLVAIVAGAISIVPRGLRGVFVERSLDINFLIMLATAGAIILGEYGEAATVVFLFSFGEALETITLARTRRSIQALMAIAPETARVRLPDGGEREVAVESVPVGATIVVRPGDRIPLDGLITTGESAVDQAPITGESVPVDKNTGDSVFGGTLNGQGYLEVSTTRAFAENTIARIIALIERAQSEKAPSQRFVEKFARIYTPTVVAAAVLLTAVPPLLFGQPVEPWFNRALVMLLIACPCALVISTPVAVVAAIGNASRNGVLIKGGAYLERAGQLRAVAFDKTGTLTYGTPEVQRVVALDGAAERDLLAWAAAAESRSEHPLAEAIVRAAGKHGVRELPPVSEFRAVTGNGITARVDGLAMAIGKPGWIEAEGFPMDAARPVLEELARAGQTPVVVARGATDGAGGRKQVLAVLAIADELRPTAAETVTRLRASGVARIVLVSGDNTATARAIAGRVGIRPEDVFGGVLPEDKVAVIRDLAARHRAVAMVGDGVNDGPALAAATVGIAMGAGGSDVALETADVALVGNDLTRLPWVLDLSRRAAWTIKVNIGFALATKAIVAVLAAFGYANLWLAILTDTGASIIVILNGMRLLGGVSTAALADVAAARWRYGLGAEDPHAGHAH
jgi:Zn2+/Cd2+-exporting ATPase